MGSSGSGIKVPPHEETKPSKREMLMRGLNCFLPIRRPQDNCVKYVAPGPLLVPLTPIPSDWVAGEVAMLQAQAKRLRLTVAKRRLKRKEKGVKQILDHYENVLTSLEHQIAQRMENFAMQA
eukprot:CAMPEP_0179224436 /NCGR_PEP_ID=MMETSP0797-20121207/7782_1 /TAXON_ID=47934 /ORGANISM="Dinophysis acuminata, Strain DAEP01" /LENGTH=121 /DNA_ID=CAMNT_0020931403 /DNA_START=60 /DNA_END=425 /DNA_ORIENTATION=-